MSDRPSTTRHLRRRSGTTYGEEVTIDLEVPFYDVDVLGIVWHGHYYKYMDRARVALLARHGLDRKAFGEFSGRVLVAEAACRYLSPLSFSDRFTVTAYFTEIEARLRVGYRIWNLSREKQAARAFTTLVLTDAEGSLLWRVPDAMKERILARASVR